MVTTGLKLPPICKAHWLGGDNGEWDQTVKPPIRQDNTMRKQFRVGAGTGTVAAAVQATFIARTRERYPNATIRYTDGSKTDRDGRVGVGFGIYTPNGTTTTATVAAVAEYHRLPAQCSVYSAEAAAIFRAITMDHQQQQQNDKTEQQQLLIVTDSASCLDALQGTSRNKRQHPYIQAIAKHMDRKRTTLMWVPAHQGIVGNEEADQLATMGRTDGTLYTTEVPGDDVCTWVERIVRRAWVQHWWQSQGKGVDDGNSSKSSNSSSSSSSSNSYSHNSNNSNRSNSNRNNSNNNSSSNSSDSNNNSSSNISNNSSDSNRNNNNTKRALFLRKIKDNPTETWADRNNWRDQRILSRLRTGHTRFSHNYNNNSRRNDDDNNNNEQEDDNSNNNDSSNQNNNDSNQNNNDSSNQNNNDSGNSSNRFESRCTECNTRNSVEHAICECRRFRQQRKMYGISDNIRMALQNDASSEAALMCFLRDTGLYGRT